MRNFKIKAHLIVKYFQYFIKVWCSVTEYIFFFFFCNTACLPQSVIAAGQCNRKYSDCTSVKAYRTWKFPPICFTSGLKHCGIVLSPDHLLTFRFRPFYVSQLGNSVVAFQTSNIKNINIITTIIQSFRKWFKSVRKHTYTNAHGYAINK